MKSKIKFDCPPFAQTLKKGDKGDRESIDSPPPLKSVPLNFCLNVFKGEFYDWRENCKNMRRGRIEIRIR